MSCSNLNTRGIFLKKMSMSIHRNQLLKLFIPVKTALKFRYRHIVKEKKADGYSEFVMP